MQTDAMKVSRQSVRYEPVYKFRGAFAVSNPATAIEEVIITIMEFLEEYLDTDWPENLDCTKDFVIDNDYRLTAESVFIQERGIWALRLKYYHDAVSTGRWFIHDAALVIDEDELKFGYWVHAEVRNNDFPVFAPQLIYHLSDECNLYQYRKIDGKFIDIASAMQIEELWTLSVLPERTLPVVIISELSNRQRTASSRHELFTLDAGTVANRLRGFAHVVRLGYDAGREWGQLVGRAFGVSEGGVRILLPGFNSETDMASDHPGNFREAILEYQYRDKVGCEAYMCHLFHATRRLIAQSKVSFEGIYFIAEAKRLKKEFDHFFNWIDRASAANEKKLQQEVAALNNTVKKREYELAQRDKELTEVGRKCAYWQDQATAMQKSIDHLTGHRQDEESIAPEEFPMDYASVAAWVNNRLAGKLILHPNAVKSLERGCYFSLELVCRGLLLLGYEYRDSQMSGDASNFHRISKQYGLALRQPNGKTNINQNSNWYIAYPPESGAKHFLKYKLERGFGKDPRHVLRIHFFWDSSNNLVVVGHLPDRLKDAND